MKKALSILCLSFLSFSTMYAQTNGTPDSSFDSDGRATYLRGNEETAYAMVVQADGKIVVGGRVDMEHNVSHFIVLRYNADGTPDSKFGTNGVAETTINGNGDVINCMALQPDGKIVVGGTTWSDITGYDLAFARYNTDGTLDNTFGSNGIKIIDFKGDDEKINNALAIQPDGKIIAAGLVHNVMSYDFILVRLNTNGTVDTSFGNNGFVITDVADATSDAVRGIALQPDGKIVAVGVSDLVSTNYFAAARYSSNGVLDATFGKSGIVVSKNTIENNEEAFAVLLQPDGKIVSLGICLRVSDSWINAQLIRYNSNGTNDATFGKNGVVYIANTDYEEIYSAVLQPDGKIVVAGYVYNTNTQSRDFLLTRLNANGTIDNTFGTEGKIITDFGFNKDDMVYAIARQNDGKIVAAGYANSAFPTTADIAIARYNTELNVGTPKAISDVEIALYPNPAKNIITVVTPKQSISQNSIITIYNTQGQLIISQPIFQERTVVNISNLDNGLYVLKQNCNNISKATRFIKK